MSDDVTAVDVPDDVQEPTPEVDSDSVKDADATVEEDQHVQEDAQNEWDHLVQTVEQLASDFAEVKTLITEAVEKFKDSPILKSLGL